MEHRIAELEIRLALQDDLLDELNTIVARQQLQLDRMQQDMRWLQQQLRSMEAANPGLPSQEIPPHY